MEGDAHGLGSFIVDAAANAGIRAITSLFGAGTTIECPFDSP